MERSTGLDHQRLSSWAPAPCRPALFDSNAVGLNSNAMRPLRMVRKPALGPLETARQGSWKRWLLRAVSRLLALQHTTAQIRAVARLTQPGIELSLHHVLAACWIKFGLCLMGLECRLGLVALTAAMAGFWPDHHMVWRDQHGCDVLCSKFGIRIRCVPSPRAKQINYQMTRGLQR